MRASYALEMRGGDLDEILSDPLVNYAESRPPFGVKLLTEIMQNKEKIDDLIQLRADRWDLHRIALIDMLIMRMSIAEMIYFDDVPDRVSINEAIEIAKSFSTERSGRFINGILDAVKKDLDRHKSKSAPSKQE